VTHPPLPIAALLTAVLTLGVGAAQSALEPEQLLVDGALRSYLVAVPAAAHPPAPALIAFHGGGSDGTYFARRTNLLVAAERHGFVVAFPDGSGRTRRLLTWNAGSCCGYAAEQGVDDVAFVGRLIDDLVARHGVDPERIYLTGMSNGAMLAYRVAAELPERIAAVAAVAGTLGIDPSRVQVPVPVLHVHGTEDAQVPYVGGVGPRSVQGMAFRSVDETIGAWVRAHGITTAPSSTALPDLADDGTTVLRHIWSTPSGEAAVVLYEVRGGGHAWPGRADRSEVQGRATFDIDVDEVLWAFFADHRRRGR